MFWIAGSLSTAKAFSLKRIQKKKIKGGKTPKRRGKKRKKRGKINLTSVEILSMVSRDYKGPFSPSFFRCRLIAGWGDSPKWNKDSFINSCYKIIRNFSIFWEADPKGTMSYRIEGEISVRPSERTSKRLNIWTKVHPEPEPSQDLAPSPPGPGAPLPLPPRHKDLFSHTNGQMMTDDWWWWWHRKQSRQREQKPSSSSTGLYDFFPTARATFTGNHCLHFPRCLFHDLVLLFLETRFVGPNASCLFS